MKNAYTRNGVTVSVDHVEGKKLPALLVSFEGEPEIYKVAAFKDHKTARWFLEVMEEFFKALPAPGGVPVVHGHNTGNARIFECSECGYGFDDIYLTNERDYPIGPNFCPNCGARMEG